MSLVDSKQRQRATDPASSYIVQAPAGSGKTEILTQRYLRLLSTVNNPEDIIAITFTKKAANEMRDRILSALKAAQTKTKPTSDHQLSTYKYASSAMQRSEDLNWDILQQPNSLRIITIDALCQMLANAIYIQDSKTAFADICDNPASIYQQAVMECLNYAASDPNYKPYLQDLLEHLDNRQENLISLFTNLLANRDNWLESLYIAKNQDKETYEAAIEIIEENAIRKLASTIDIDCQTSLFNLIQKLLHVTNNFENSLNQATSLAELNSETSNKLAKILLTGNGNLRKTFDHHVGLKKGICTDPEYKDIKSTSKELLAYLNENPDFIESLLQVKDLPHPKYSQHQWQILQALFNLLPLLIAHLEVVFNQNNCIDFSGIANAALLALGDDMNPTNLALYLDNKIQHILIDEFQDTSIKQFNLLTMLVKGWEQGDGRTLFIVGDPQQSIYRFRGAEVGLFLRAKHYGVGQVQLNYLELACNFRSDSLIVNWVNTYFKDIFPSTNDISSGAIQYSHSTPTQSGADNSFICATEFTNSEDEANFIIDIIQKELRDEVDSTIAILARSRRQLSIIVNKLREKNLSYLGVDIDLLASLSHIRDLHSLTKSLLMPANRLAWLALLRSPFCGLALEDILNIATFDRNKSIYYALSRLDEIPSLSESGYTRAKYVYTKLHYALQTRAQDSIINWLNSVLQSLNYEAIFNQQQLNDFQQYWHLLESFLIDGEVSNWTLFSEQLQSLYSTQTSASRIQIMTIHKSKGLEFDCVIIPGVGAKSANADSSLFRTLNLPIEDSQDILLVSPIKASFAESCSLYSYIKKIDEQKDTFELQRLLYVAATRAKKRLYLTDKQTSTAGNSFRKFLRAIDFETHESSNLIDENTSTLPKLMRLPDKFYTDTSLSKPFSEGAIQFSTHEDNARITGIVTHELLQLICDKHIQSYAEVSWSLVTNRLLSYGITNQELESTLKTIKQHIKDLYADPTGLWIISRHEHEHNEYELVVKSATNYKTKIIDRTFICDDTLWIIDFKTGQDTEESEEKYIQQVTEYAKLLSRNDIKIKCGIYYLTNNNWVTWQYNQVEKQNLSAEKIDA